MRIYPDTNTQALLFYSVPTSRRKLDSIQALRALAVLLVVYYHSMHSADEQFGPSTQSSFFQIREWGAIGVDLFFVISGFIMTRTLPSYQRPGGWESFAFKRAIRIIPLYWGLSLLASLWILRTYQLKLSVIWKMLTFIPVFETDFVFPVISAGWSLSYEVYFYLLIGLALRMRIKHPQVVLTGWLIMVSFAGMFIQSRAMLPRFLFSPLLAEFALGIGCGLVYDAVQPDLRWHRIGVFTAFFVGLILISSPIFFDYGDIHNAGKILEDNQLAGFRSVVWGIPSALFVLGCILLERIYSVAMPPVLLRIGDASYSNYLLHMLLMLFGHKTLVKLNFLSADGYILFVFVLSTALSLPLYRFVEKPMTDLLTDFVLGKKKQTVLNTAT